MAVSWETSVFTSWFVLVGSQGVFVLSTSRDLCASAQRYTHVFGGSMLIKSVPMRRTERGLGSQAGVGWAWGWTYLLLCTHCLLASDSVWL